MYIYCKYTDIYIYLKKNIHKHTKICHGHYPGSTPIILCLIHYVHISILRKRLRFKFWICGYMSAEHQPIF